MTAAGFILVLTGLALGVQTVQGAELSTLRFEPNAGQMPAAVKFAARAQNYTVFVTSGGVTLRSKTSTLKLTFLGANPVAEAEGLDPIESPVHYLIGDAGDWHTDIPTYRRLAYRNVYPGVDVIYYGDGSGQLEYDLVAHPGAALSQIRLHLENGEPMQMDGNGDMVVRTADGEWRHTNPAIYQQRDSARRKVRGQYLVLGSNEIGIDIGDYDHSFPLIIDPALTYSTYLGGTGQDAATAISVDLMGNAYVTGWTESLDFPEAAGPRLGNPGGVDVFVAKLNPSGKLLYVTYLGGSSDDRGYGIAVDRSGAAVVVGWTYSTNFPVLNPAQPRVGGGRDGFVAKLNPAGNALVFSTYLGGAGSDCANAVAVDPQDNIYVAGDTASSNFPTLNGFQPRPAGGMDAFVTKFSSAGARLWGTFLGGSADDQAKGIAVDAAGNAYITGGTFSTDFPVINAVQPALGGGQDAFVTKVDSTGSRLLYSTYIGGSGGTVSAPEIGNGIAVDQTGCAYIAGTTSSANFPTFNSLRSALNGGQDAFVVKLSPTGNVRVYSTYLGGSSIDTATAIAVDATGMAFVSGWTVSTDFPTSSAVQNSSGGGYDGFIAALDTSGSSLLMATYIGGTGSDSVYGITLDSSRNVFVAGQTASRDFPSASAVQVFQPSMAAAFVAKLVAPVSPPTVSASPSLGRGSTALVTFSATDANGAAAITVMYIVVGSQNACFLAFTPASQQLILSNNTGGWIAASRPGQTGTVQNTYCGIDMSGSAFTSAGNTVSLTLRMTFSSGLAGNQPIYLLADSGDLTSNWLQVSSWNVR
jgi:hypothetical protein